MSRVDIPSGWIDFVIESPKPYLLNPLFTRDPAKIGDERILKAMMAIKGIYGEYGVQVLNHGVGYDTSAIDSSHLRGRAGTERKDLQTLGIESPSDHDTGD